MILPHSMYIPHYGNHDFSPLADDVYRILIINKTPLCNGNCPIMDPITKMGIAHTMKL